MFLNVLNDKTLSKKIFCFINFTDKHEPYQRKFWLIMSQSKTMSHVFGMVSVWWERNSESHPNEELHHDVRRTNPSLITSNLVVFIKEYFFYFPFRKKAKTEGRQDFQTNLNVSFVSILCPLSKIYLFSIFFLFLFCLSTRLRWNPLV